MRVNAFTVDVEDYFHVSAFEKHIDRAQWNRHESRVVANTHRLLELLDRHDVKATFFVLGWVAHRHPGLVQEIHGAGHEIGSHGYWHRLVYDQSPQQFRHDLQRSREVVEASIGQRITAYRAPSFSITRRSLWALDILAEQGFLIDSSIYPVYHNRYGIPGVEPRIHQIRTPAGSLWEFPPSVVRFGRLNVPVGGGGYFRLYPFCWTRWSLARWNRTTGQPFMFYVHPWEIDPKQPRLRVGSRMSRWRHHVNLRKTDGKLHRLLQTFRFGRLCDVISHAAEQEDRHVICSEALRDGEPQEAG